MKKNRLFLFPALAALGLALGLGPTSARAQCTPISAQILTSGDDNTSFWINGTQIPGGGVYCNIGCIPTPIPVPTTVFNQGQSIVLSVATTNVNPNLIFSSWALDITCSGGDHSVVTSETYPAIPLYYDPNGACAGDAPPPLDGGGNPWTAFLYNPASNPFTLTGSPVTGTTYATRIYNPVTGDQIPPVSYDPSGAGGSCGVLYWRQTLVLPTPLPTLGPPAVTVTNTFLPGSVSISGSQYTASSAVSICNTGSPISSVPVTLLVPFSFLQGNPTGCPQNSGQPQEPQYQCGNPWQVIFPVGLPGGGQCQAVTVNMIDYNYPNHYCAAVTSVGNVNWPANGSFSAGTAASNTVTFTIPCAPTATPTFTPTLTFTRTCTFTPTSSFTPTFTRTPTWTPTLRFTSTFTHTPTLTFTPTITPTPTNTLSPTPTSTPTFTFTPTLSPTPCGYPGNTCTPTPTPVDLFYVSENAFNPDQKSVSIFVAYPLYPGGYALKIYNSAGEHVKTLDSQSLTSSYSKSYTWDGTNKYGDKCASGIYILYLEEPFDTKVKRILLVH